MDKFIMGVDIGFANTGVVLFKVKKGVGNVNIAKYYASTVIVTKKSDKKKQIRVADDDIQRIIHVVQQFLKFTMHNMGIDFRRKVIAFAEAPTGGAKSSSAQKAMGMATAMSATMFELIGIPVEYVAPRDVKIAVCGDPHAAKEDIMDSVISLIKGSIEVVPTKIKGGKIRNDKKYITPNGKKYGQNFEHIADAVGALLHSKRKSQMFKMYMADE